MARDTRTQPLPTSGFERRLIAAAGAGDRAAQHRLLKLYEPMVRTIASRYFVPGAEPEDLAQEARMAILDATPRWEPARGVPFSSFAWMCATREARTVVQAARARKHLLLTLAASIDALDEHPQRSQSPWASAVARKQTRRTPVAMQLVGPPDDDPVTKVISREQLRLVARRGRALSPLERRALALATTDHTHHEIAETLHVGVRAVNNALQRARCKLRNAQVA
ncbi:sigma-70 family RNA polymerase sigma factor [Solirubrobacter pauli]|uniref:sigma-70 family RNA polymerase sigma factor n=1 Tax=Solirubrobacter pauli TaxID=166793 RepID=UPI000EAEBA24|nr:sigma-70 family RNA polymerase sigma factor [Solirubrobacter pauli]